MSKKNNDKESKPVSGQGGSMDGIFDNPGAETAIDGGEQIISTEYSELMQKAYIDYAMSVIVSRALPDVRDGMKPGQRRVMYAMYEDHLTHDKPFRKSATTVGNVLGRYHPTATARCTAPWCTSPSPSTCDTL